jgi:proteasome lid subunit RPN8/RPN11
MSGEALPPWARADLRVTRAALEAAEAEAVRRYPEEGCGFMAGPANVPDLVDEARPEANEANRYHAIDPTTFPRTARTYFKINELRAARAFDQGAATGRPIKVIFHSHCDAGAYFSEEDAATFAHDGRLMWPCACLVVSVEGGRVADRRLWVHVEGAQEFREARLSVV